MQLSEQRLCKLQQCSANRRKSFEFLVSATLERALRHLVEEINFDYLSADKHPRLARFTELRERCTDRLSTRHGVPPTQSPAFVRGTFNYKHSYLSICIRRQLWSSFKLFHFTKFNDYFLGHCPKTLG